MTGLEGTQPTRLITATRTLAELLDNCADSLASTFLAATALLLVIITLHAIADVLENCPDALRLCTTQLVRKVISHDRRHDH
ncbi:hypothetical protein [Nonomuraea endophytica]|uniref:Uncharacterized protein n=1 Tax=Nonomuraea endophytica TaxID=714136 RepID=A0A7W8A2H2_9ACTN|nr:hypothetical protein [Nonomuraea endophytica]MBB5077779.1 hypothetical protein [Nonomuraea endophytica]